MNLRKLKGNTVGSTNTDFWNFKTKEDIYIFGLWCADGYQRTSSIGLSNTDLDLIERFRKFLLQIFPKERLKLNIYEPDNYKRRTKAYHLYVNSRPLLRLFNEIKNNLVDVIYGDLIVPYMAGRFDGDGSVAKNFYSDCRIVYSTEEEATKDLILIQFLGFYKTKIYHYRKAKTFCLYFARSETRKFLYLIYPYSLKLQKSVFVPRRDLISKRP